MSVQLNSQALKNTFSDCIMRGNLRKMKRLIEKYQISKEFLDAGCYVYWASYYGKLEILKELLKVGPNVNKRLNFEDYNFDEDDQTQFLSPLHVAASKGFTKIAKCLLLNGAKVHNFNVNATPLHIAAGKGHLKIVKLLLKFGTDINSYIMERVFTPLYMATVKGTSKKVVKYLLKCGANPNVANDSGNTLIHEICYKHCVKRWILNDSNGEEDEFETPRLDFIPMLVAHGADIKARNKDNFSALDVAIIWKNNRLTKVLVPFYCPETKIYNSIYPLDKFVK